MRIPFLRSRMAADTVGPRDELKGLKPAPKDALTLLLPSKGRAEMLQSLLRYYERQELPYKILVLVSGDNELHQAEHYPNLDVQFRYYTEDTDFNTKIADGAARVTSTLVALVTDDDITFAEGLSKSAAFLLKNPDYSACQGYHAYFSQQDNTVNLTHVAWFTPSCSAEKPLARVHASLQRYQPICWAVFRTGTFQNICASAQPELPLIFQELIWSLTALIEGKVKRLPLLYCLRRAERGHISAHPFLAMFDSPSRYLAAYVQYRDTIVAKLLPHADRDRDAIERMLDLSHLGFFTANSDRGTINFFSDAVLADPMTSIRDEGIDHILRPKPLHATQGWEKLVNQDGIEYHLFADFLRPQPTEEIHLAAEYETAVIAEIGSYFHA